MTNAIYRILGICSLMLLLAACSHSRQPMAVDDMDDANGGGDTPVDIIVSRSTFTDAGDNGETDTKFTPGCHIGVAVVGSAEYGNVQYKYPESGSALVAVGEKIYCGTQSTLKAYYPYRDDGNYDIASVEADQSTGDNYYESDALEAEGTISNGTLNLQFGHRMTKVILTFNEDVSDLTILNQSLSTDAATGTASIKPYKESAQKWKACIVPGQTRLKVTGKKESRDFTATFNADSAMLAGNQYSYTISSSIDISGCIRKDLSEGNVSINDNYSYYIEQSDIEIKNNLVIEGGTPTIYIDNLVLPKIRVLGRGKATFVLVGINTINHVSVESSNAALVIKGNGVLSSECITGGKSIEIDGATVIASGAGNWAGIGAGGLSWGYSCGDITIRNANIVARGGTGAAAIGTGYAANGTNISCGNILIENSCLDVSAGAWPQVSLGAAIGVGSAWMGENRCGTITINNSTLVVHYCDDFHGDVGIGSGAAGNPCGRVSITNCVINGETVTEIYTRKHLADGSVSISDNDSYYITQRNNHLTTGKNITVTGGTPTIYMRNLNISAGTAVNITGGTPTIILIGNNTLRSTGNGIAGIRLQGANTHVVIKGNGTLNSSGGAPDSNVGGGPGIGVSSGTNEEGGNISIEGGTIICTGGHDCAAAIGTGGGAGVNSKCGSISIKNATLTLSKAENSAAIGTGYAVKYDTDFSALSCGAITVENSTLTIENTTGFGQSFIGKGNTDSGSTNNCGQVTITGSTINGTVVNDTYNP